MPTLLRDLVLLCGCGQKFKYHGIIPHRARSKNPVCKATEPTIVEGDEAEGVGDTAKQAGTPPTLGGGGEIISQTGSAPLFAWPKVDGKDPKTGRIIPVTMFRVYIEEPAHLFTMYDAFRTKFDYDFPFAFWLYDLARALMAVMEVETVIPAEEEVLA